MNGGKSNKSNKNNKPITYEEFRKSLIKNSRPTNDKRNFSESSNNIDNIQGESNSVKTDNFISKDKNISSTAVQKPKTKNSIVTPNNKLNLKNNKKIENRVKRISENNVNKEAEKQKIINKNRNIVKRKKSELSNIDVERIKRGKRKNKISKGIISHKQRKKRIKQFIVFIITVVVAVCLFAVFKMFFNIEEIIIQGQTRYNINKIVSLCEINIGENIFFCDNQTGAEKIKSVMPYIENVTIKRKLPNKIIINVEETTAAYAVEYKNEYLLVSSNGKILERINDKPKDLIILRGLNIVSPELSTQLKQTDSNSADALKLIMDSIEKNNLKDIKLIDLSLTSNIRVYYQNRIAIVIGIPQNIDYKLRNAYNIIQTRLPFDAEGILDVSVSDSDYKTSYFTEQSLDSIFGNDNKDNTGN